MACHLATGMTFFEAIYGHPPPTLCNYAADTSIIASVDELLITQHSILAILRDNLV